MIKQVKIGGINYQIKLADEPIIIEEKGETEHGGLIDYANATITLHKHVSPEYLELVLLHEILHGIWEHMGINETNDELEDIISKLANGLYGVLKDNDLKFK